MQSSAFSQGGSASGSANFALYDIIGAPFESGEASSENYLAHIGFLGGEALISDVETGDQRGLPAQYELLQNYPNPFNPATTIEFALPRRGEVEIAILNLLGRRVRSLLSGQKDPGYYSITWDGLDDHGSRAASGIYIYLLRTDGFTASRKLLLLK